MKALMTAVFLVVSFSAMAIPNKNCYPFAKNQDGFDRVCVMIENPFSANSGAEVEIYRFEKLVYFVPAIRVHNEQEQICNDPRFPRCYRRYEGLRILPTHQNTDDVKFEIAMRVNRRSTCLNGQVTIREQNRDIALNVLCADPAWSRK